jgi:hypothetical protein
VVENRHEHALIAQSGMSFDQVTEAWYYQYVFDVIPPDTQLLELHYRVSSDAEFFDVVIELPLH